ncbi:MAG: type II secretion system protein [Victivallaceae bacterium]|nr:type II secretion system protein [Victivallaceae bacterium]
MPQNKNKKRRFSLIELLAVMAIFGLLLTLLLPSFNRMINGSKVDQMSSQLKLELERAQSRAVTSRRYVALILPYYKSYIDDMDSCFGGSRMAYVGRPTLTETEANAQLEDGAEAIDNSKKWEIIEWVQPSEWKKAIDGAYLHRIQKKTTWDSVKSTLKGNGFAVNKKATSDLVYDDLTEIKYDGKKYRGLVFSPYGGTIGIGSDLYFTVVESMLNKDTSYIKDFKGSFAFPSSDGTYTANFIVLKLNQFTGRVAYENMD